MQVKKTKKPDLRGEGGVEVVGDVGTCACDAAARDDPGDKTASVDGQVELLWRRSQCNRYR